MRKLYFTCSFIFAIFLGACSDLNTDSLEEVSVFRYNESKGISSLDPAYARNQTIIWPVSQIFNGLVQLDDNLRVVPSISRSWLVSEDKLSYTFYLRSDVYFHESEIFSEGSRKVVASDFVFSFNRILDPTVASPGSWVFDYVREHDGFESPNDSTLVIHLKDPFPPFLSILAMPYCYVVPSEAFLSGDKQFASSPVGTGPFTFKFWSPEEKLILLKNSNYFERNDEGNPLPYLDAIAISFIKDKQSEFLEFLKGNLDFLSGVHPAYKDELLTRSGTLNPKYREQFKLITMPYLNTEYLGILMDTDAAGDQLLQDRNVRLAINYGFDRVKMMKYLRNNLGYPASAGMIPPGLDGFLGEGKGYEFQPDYSRELLSEYKQRTGNELPALQLTTTSDYLDLCEFIQFELEKIGLDIRISVSTGGAFRNMVANANLPFFRGSWIADYADAENYLALFYSGNFTPEGPNYTHFFSEEYDKLYEESILITDLDQRTILYQKMDSIIVDQAPVVPLYYDMVVRFTPNSIEGFNPNPMNNLVLKTVKKKALL